MNIPSLQKPAGIFPLVLLAILTLPLIAIAGPGEEANAVIDRWSAAYSSNDPEAVVKNYRPDAILLGTESPVIIARHRRNPGLFLKSKRKWE